MPEDSQGAHPRTVTAVAVDADLEAVEAEAVVVAVAVDVAAGGAVGAAEGVEEPNARSGCL